MRGLLLGSLGLLMLACQHLPGRDAERHRSSFGFTAEIPAAWQAVDPAGIPEGALTPEADALADVDPELLADFARAVRGGDVEIFYRTGELARDFVDNVSVRATPGVLPSMDRDVLASCDVLVGALSAAYGRPVELSVCELRRVAEQRSLYVEASGAVEGIHSLQYLIERESGSLIVVTGTTQAETLPALRGELSAMVGSLELE